MFRNKKVLIGICGSIAAYKTILLVRELIRAGAEVKVIMTPAATDFVGPLTLSTLSKNPVHTDMFKEGSWANHVMLGRWADVLLIAPLSCNTLAKMANGLCDNLLLATYLSATCPVVVAPAMDEDMWKHPSTRENLDRIARFGNRIIPVETGELASGLNGPGRMAEPEQILQYLSNMFESSTEFSGKTVLVTAGPTHEPIDPVRFIGNNSSGKMGVAIARELAQRGAKVHLVLGPSALQVEMQAITLHRVKTAEQMYDRCMEYAADADILILSAAVADYTPAQVSDQKIKKNGQTLSLELKKTTDILKTLGAQKQPGQLLVGFALETFNELEHAREKLYSKNADLIVLNSLNDEGAGFGHDTNKVTLLKRDGSEQEYPVGSKQQVARDIVDTIKMMHHV